MCLAVFAAVAVITLLRVPIAHIDALWAEDGGLFLQQHLYGSAWSVIFEGYGGYQHLIPRLVTALLVSVVPLGGIAIAISVACATLTGAVSVAIFWLSRDLVPWLPARLGLAAITALLPLSSVEVSLNLADFHSYCLWLMPWLLFHQPRRLASGVGWGVVAFLCAMTEIQSVLFFPLLLVLLRREHRFAWPIGAGFALGMLGQLITTVLLPRDSAADFLGVPSLVLGYLYNTVLPMLNPDIGWEVSVLSSSGPLVPALLLIPFVAATIVTLVWGTRMQRILAVTLLFSSFVVFVAGASIDGGEYFRYAEHANAAGFEGMLNVRYGVASGFFLAATIPLAAAVLVRIASARAVRWPRVVAWVATAGLLVLFAFAGLQADSVRGSGVSWSGNVETARESCESLEPDDVVRLGIAPERDVVATCDDLLP